MIDTEENQTAVEVQDKEVEETSEIAAEETETEATAEVAVAEAPEAETADEPEASDPEKSEEKTKEEPTAVEVEEEDELENVVSLDEIKVDDDEDKDDDDDKSPSASVSAPSSDEITIVEAPGNAGVMEEDSAVSTGPYLKSDRPTTRKTSTSSDSRPLRKRWYIVHTYSGHENKVKVNLERRIESMNMGDKIFRVEVPQKQVTKIKEGRRIEKDERIFPGYVLVEMLMDDDSWYVVRHTPGVTKFVGSEKKPIPAKDSEIKRILLRAAPASAKVEIDLKVGETVKIISGPFADFEGTVTEVNPDKEKLKATVSIFGRETPVELVFSQVQKA